MMSLVIQNDMWKLLGREDLKKGALELQLRYLNAITEKSSYAPVEGDEPVLQPGDSLPTRVDKYKQRALALLRPIKKMAEGQILASDKNHPCDLFADAYDWNPIIWRQNDYISLALTKTGKRSQLGYV